MWGWGMAPLALQLSGREAEARSKARCHVKREQLQVAADFYVSVVEEKRLGKVIGKLLHGSTSLVYLLFFAALPYYSPHRKVWHHILTLKKTHFLHILTLNDI